MKTEKTLILWALITFLILVAAFFSYWDKKRVIRDQENELALTAALKNRPVSQATAGSEDHILGNLDGAKIVVIEYSNTECPYCKTFHDKFKNQVFSSSNDLAWIYRHFPLPIFSKSPKEAEALECAAEQGGNEMFWAYLEAVFKVTPSNDGLDLTLLPELANSLKLNTEEFNRCLEEGRFAEKVKEQKLGGAKLGVYQTPSVIIWDKSNGEKRLISGANSRFQEVKAVIENLRQQQNNTNESR